MVVVYFVVGVVMGGVVIAVGVGVVVVGGVIGVRHKDGTAGLDRAMRGAPLNANGPRWKRKGKETLSKKGDNREVRRSMRWKY